MQQNRIEQADREKIRDIYERTLQYALRSIRVVEAIERKGYAGGVIGKQFVRAATSVGANIVEAQSAESRRDFIHKYSIAQKEANESLYWLTLIEQTAMVPPRRLYPLIVETREIIAIITTILIRTKRYSPSKPNPRSR